MQLLLFNTKIGRARRTLPNGATLLVALIGYCFVNLTLIALPPQTAAGQEASAQRSKDVAWRQFGSAVNWEGSLSVENCSNLKLNWKMDVGEGRCQVVGDEETVFVASGKSAKSEASKKTETKTTVTAYEVSTRKQIWSYQIKGIFGPKQQSFGGDPASPQSTPLYAGNRLVFMDFVGNLTCLDAKTGEQKWTKNLPKENLAQPVQFGSSSSPILSQLDAKNFLVFAGGEKSGLLNLKIETGEVNWISPIDTFSYATPVAAKFGETSQWIVVSQNGVYGIDAKNGSQLWNFPMAEKGLTNVPSPLVLDNSRLLISGQGVKGTRCIEVTQTGAKWNVQEKWFAKRYEFFYQNWLKLNDQIALACSFKYLAIIDTKSGELLERWRGYGDGNLIKVGNHILALSGDGKLGTLKTNGDQIAELDLFQITENRCWTPLSVIGRQLFVRCNKTLYCLSLKNEPSSTDLKKLTDGTSLRTAQLSMNKSDSSKTPSKKIDYVSQIFDVFENQGQRKALELYSKLRAEKLLSAEDCLELIEAAREQGLGDVAKMILSNAAKDFPDSKSIRQMLRQLK